jgi:hypothetical protein
MDESWGVPIGVPVITADGRRLGTLTQADAYELLVEDGLLVHRTYALNLIDVARYQDGAQHLKLTAAEAIEGRRVG